MYIAYLEDDADQAAVVKEWLTTPGHKCDVYDDGRKFIQGIKRHTYDLLVLDWLVPELSGIEVLQWVRENIEWQIPVIFTTQMDREEDVVQVLSLGADDYMAKPVKRRELLARIDTIRRRSLNNGTTHSTMEFDPYSIDCEHRILECNGEEISLTHIEFDLTVFMFRNYGRILSRSYILENVWGINADLNTRTVDTHVSRIRKKLRISPAKGWRLSPVYQHGYRLERLRQSAHDDSA